MAEFKDGSYQCLPGPALIAKALAGRCTMKYTRAAVGQGTIPDGVSPKELTAPPDYVMEAKIAAVTNPVDGECQVTVQINSSDVETGFYAMGIMLYAEDPDLGEVPYTYLKLEEGLEWIRPASSAVGKLATFDLIAAVGAVDAVSANIDPDAIATFAAVKELITEHNTSPDAHADIREAARHTSLYVGDQEPEKGPMLWFNTGTIPETDAVVLLKLGGENDASDVAAAIDGKEHPVINAAPSGNDADHITVEIKK